MSFSKFGAPTKSNTVLGFGEAFIDVQMVNICQAIHFSNNMASSCRSLCLNWIFQLGIRFFWKGDRIYPSPSFRKIIDKYWIAYGKNAYDKICVMGVIPVKYAKIPGTNIRVPAVVGGRLGIDYNIIVKSNMNGLPEYIYVKLRSSKTGFPIPPQRSKGVTVLSGFGYDPLPDGRLVSIVASIVNQDYMVNRMMMYMLLAEYNRSDPIVLTEVGQESVASIRPDQQWDFYIDRDRSAEESEGRFELNKQEIAQIVENQRLVEQHMPLSGSDPTAAIDVMKKHIKDNIFHLPAGHRLARQNMPDSRHDWTDLNKHAESIICAAYEVPRALLIADTGMSETSVKLTEKTMINNVNTWKNMLSSIYTDAYRDLYGDDDNEYASSLYTDDDTRKMTDNELFNVATEPRVTVVLPIIPLDSHEMLLQKYALGIIDWRTYVESSKRISGDPTDITDESIPNSERDDNEDPWNQEFKLSMLRSARGTSLSSLGLVPEVMFGKKPAIMLNKGDKQQNGNSTEGNETQGEVEANEPIDKTKESSTTQTSSSKTKPTKKKTKKVQDASSDSEGTNDTKKRKKAAPEPKKQSGGKKQKT